MVTPQTLQAINDMQVNVQTGLPVIPNNGNPAGAYNMPQHLGGAMPAQAAPDPYAWLQPSPAMMMLQQQLQANGARLQQQLSTMSTPQAPMQQSVVMPTQQPMLPPQQPPQVIPQMSLAGQPQMMPQQPQSAPVLPIRNTPMVPVAREMVR